jgi:hypothetical protein
VRTRTALLVHSLVLGLTLCVCAQAPMIPPTIAKISPAGMERGETAAFTIDGRSLSGATEVIFDTPGLSGKVTAITDIPEKITGPRAKTYPRRCLWEKSRQPQSRYLPPKMFCPVFTGFA